MDKIHFLKNEFPLLAAKINADAKGSWGVLNAQQMVEHMSDSISFATGKNNQKLISPVEKVDVFKAFAMSDKEFKPNTPNSLMSEIPAPAKHPNMQASIDELKQTIADFIQYFDNNKGSTLTNPFFGELNFEEWTHLLYKHAVHHCKQFGLL